MKRIATLLIAAGLVLGAASGAKAIDFKAKGEWIFGMGVAESSFLTSPGSQGQDVFQALQRVRLQMDAVASDSLSGVVYFEIGDQNWGRGKQGAALGADGTIVEVKRAYIDWMVPSTDLNFRMGIQGIVAPNAAGGSAILDDDMAGIMASYKVNDNVAITATWARLLNDNYTKSVNNSNPSNYLDNVDLFALSVPVTLDGFKVTPWAAYGMIGKNAMDKNTFEGIGNGQSASLGFGTMPADYALFGSEVSPRERGLKRKNAYGDMFFVGLPIEISAFDPFNIELDLNYGYAGGFGKYDSSRRMNNEDGYVASYARSDSTRSGWLVKGLFEYKMASMTPGIIAWYASGDDDNIKNGSERLPSISASGNFSSFMGDGAERGWSLNTGYDRNLTYDGTWGVGLQLKDMSFLEGLSHTFRAIYWGGTNSQGMIKYLTAGNNANIGATIPGSPYLTTADYLVEFNLDSTFKVYENLNAVVELGYIINGFDKDAWRKSSYQTNFTKADGYKAALLMQYQF